MPRTKIHDLDELAPYMLPAVPRGTNGPPIVWSRLFGNDNPVEIEVGFGKGLFLLTASERQPETNFLGIEIERRFQIIVAHEARAAGRTNIRVACADGREVLSDRVASGSVAVVHVYFPDPWWKFKHRKRRVFTPAFAHSAGQVLRVGGRLSIATDVQAYHIIMTQIIRELGLGFRELAAAESNEPIEPLTHFERKFREQGRPIYRAAFERTALPLIEVLKPDPGLAGPFDEYRPSNG